MVSAQLQQGLLDLVYFTWLHNAEVLAYFVGILLSLYFLLKNPNRKHVFLLLGFVFLLVEFEYVKHIVQPLLDQTLQTVLQTGASATRFQKITKFLLQKLAPIGMYLFGWGSIFYSLFTSSKSNDSKSS